MKPVLIASLALGLGANVALASEYDAAMKTFLEGEILSWATDPVLLGAIAQQNAVTSDFDQDRIEALDQTWRAEVGSADTPTITTVLENAAAAFLRDRVAASGGAITEVFVMDAQGLNVAASAVTSDYWQGDEAKFQQTYSVGQGAVHFGEVEFDESSQQYQAQISLSLTDPTTGAVVGAMTVGVNADNLM